MNFVSESDPDDDGALHQPIFHEKEIGAFSPNLSN